jgi:hypothetical protein
MRWDELFDDLEAQAEQAGRDERAGEIEQRARIEISKVGVLDRFRPAVGTVLRLRCAGSVSVTGTLRRIGADWLLLDESPSHEVLVPLAGVLTVGGLGRLSALPGSGSAVSARLGLGHALRGIARDRSAVQITLLDASQLDGTIDRVGSDFVELATHNVGELRRRSEVRQVLVLPMSGLAVLRRAGEAR